MVKANNGLLELIHQHLLRSGYCKAARELQIESGEKFSSPKVNLEKIYKKWHKKAKKRKGGKSDDAHSKKPRVQDPASSSESSDNEDKTLQKEDKKHSVKKTTEVKPASTTSKKMNSTKQSSAKAKSTPMKATPPVKPVALDTKAAASSSVSSDSSDSEEEVAVAPPVLATIVNPTPAAEKKSVRSATSESAGEPSKQIKAVPDITAAAKIPTARKPRNTAAANRKAAVMNDVSESSDDETDIEKQSKAVMRTTSSASKTTAVLPASQTRSSQGKTPNPTMVSASESSSDDSDSEEGLENQKVTPVVQATPKKRATPVSRTKAVASKAPKPEAVAVDSKPAGSGELGSSGSVVKDTQKISTPIRGSTKKKQQPVTPFSLTPGAGKAKTPPQVSQHAAAESSEADMSDSDNEPLTKAVSAAPVRNSVPSTPVAAAKPSAPASASAPDSDADSESSDSSDFEVKQPVVTTPKSATPAVASKGNPQASAALQPADETSSEDSDSDSDEETVTTVPAAAAPVGKAEHGKGLVASKPQSADSSETSDSVETEAELKPAAATSKSTKPAVAPKEQPQLSAALTPDEESSSEDSESDDSEEPVKTKPLQPANQKTGAPIALTSILSKNTVAKGKASVPAKTAPVGKLAPADDSESSDTDSDDEEEEEEALKIVTPPPTTVKTKDKVTPASKPSSSRTVKAIRKSPEKPAVTAKAAASIGAKKGKPQTAAKPTPMKSLSPAKTPVVAKPSSEESSDASDSEEEEPVQKLELPTMQKTGAPGTLKSPPSKITVAKGKASVPTKTPPVGKLAPADDSESSDTDSYEEMAQVVTPPPSTVKAKERKTTAKMTKTPTSSSAIKMPVSLTQEPSVGASKSSGVSPVKKIKASASIGAKKGKPATATTTAPSPAITPLVAKPAAEESSDTSSSGSEEEEPVKKLQLPTKQKTGALMSPLSKNTAATGKASVPTKTPPVRKLAPADDSESSGTDSEEETDQVVTPVTPSAVKTKNRKVTGKIAKPPIPSSIKLEKATSPVKMLVKFKQEPVDSYPEKSAVKGAKKEGATTPAAVKPMQGKRARNLAKIPESSLPAAKQSKPKATAKAPVSQTAAESSSSSSDSEEDSAEKLTIATPKPAAPANVSKVAAATPHLSRESSSEDSESESEAEPAIPAITVASVVAQKGKSRSAAKPTPLKAPSPVKSPVAAKPPAEESSDATSSDSEEEEPVQQTPTVPQKILSPVKVPGKVQQSAASSSQKSATSSAPATSKSQAKDSESSDTESSDSDDAPEVQSKLSSVGILKPALKPVGKLPGVGAAVSQTPVKAVNSAVNKSGSMLENSQLLLEEPAPSKATPKKRKTASQVEDKLGSVAEKPVKAKKQKTESKRHVQPIAPPVLAPPAPQTTPGAMLESEEETVLALLEGRNPKKNKKGEKSSKKKSGEGPQAEALIPEQATNTGLAPSLWVPDTPNSVNQGDLKSPSAQKIAQPPAENLKSGKKRKISPEDDLAKQEAKLAKKAKKEKKHKAGAEGETATAKSKSSKKDKKKSEKKKAKKKKDSKEKKHKKDKKVTLSVTGPVGESTDSGISLLSKPKKKKKVKADKDSLKTS